MRYLIPLFFSVLLLTMAWGEAKHAATPTDHSGSYTLDKSHASVVFTIKHLGFSNYTGRFDTVDAKLSYDAKTPANSKLEASLSPASVDTNNHELEERLKSDKYFNVQKFEKVSFTSTGLKLRDKNRGTLTGNLTMLGITKPVRLNVTLNQAGPNPYTSKTTLGFSATATLKRSDWGLSTLIPQVADEVKVYIEAEFIKD